MPKARKKPGPKPKNQSTPKPQEPGVFALLEGSYYSRQPGKIAIAMPFQIELQLTDNPNFQLPADSKILSICRYKLLPRYFQQKYNDFPDYAGIRECRLTNTKVCGGTIKPERATPLEEMSLDELQYVVFEEDLPVDPASASSINGSRQMVIDAIENKKLEALARQKAEEERRRRQEEEFADTKEILEFAEANAI